MSTLAPGRRSARHSSTSARSTFARIDWVLIASVAAISALSLYAIDAGTREDIPGSPNFFTNRQAIFVAGGVLLMIAAASVDIRRFRPWAWALWGGLMGSLAVVFVVGGAVRGTSRWIELGSFNLQPSEFGKIVLIVVVAALVSDRADQIGTTRFTFFMLGVAGAPALVVFLQPDLGTAMVYLVILGAVLFVAGVPWTHFATAGVAVFALAIGVFWILPAQGVEVLQPYQKDRLTAFATADRDTSDSGYQLDQSKTAIGSGGAVGKGPDGATQTNNDFLPEHHTDFIFAVTGEMFGFVGAGSLILLLGIVVWRGVRIASAASTKYEILIASAIVAMLAFQVFVNIGMTVGLMPITGIPLPFMSFGGSHTLATFAALGVLLGIGLRRGTTPPAGAR